MVRGGDSRKGGKKSPLYNLLFYIDILKVKNIRRGDFFRVLICPALCRSAGVIAWRLRSPLCRF